MGVTCLWALVSMATIYMASSVYGGHVFCYYSSFAQTRQGVGKFLPEKIDPFLCSHVIYAFVDITADGTGLKPFNRNDQGVNGLYARTLALKKQNPDLKVLLAVGGWRIGSKPFIPMVSSEGNRRTWVKNVVEYLRRHSFDGFDVDWEFPATRGSPSEDKYRFTSLMKELYEAFAEEAQETGRDKLLLTMATASGTYYIDQSYEPRKIIRYIDFMLLMTYNYHGQWEKTTGHHSGLYGHRADPKAGEKSQLNQEWSIDYWLDVGISPEKLIVGIPTYGMSFTLEDSTQHGVHAPAIGGGKIGDYTRETGILSYYEICLNQREKGWERDWIDDQAAPYTFYGNQWAGYDDVKSVVLKSENIVRRGLAGAFVWSVEMDDFNGVCDQGRYPLLTAINDVIKGQGRKTQSNPKTLDFSHTKLEAKVEAWKESTNDDDEEEDEENDSNNADNHHYKNEVIKRKKDSRKRGHKIKGKPKMASKSASRTNPNLKNDVTDTRKKSKVAKTRKTLTTEPREWTPFPTSSSSPASTTPTSPSSSSTTRQSLKVKWWSGVVYRKKSDNSPSDSMKRQGGGARRRMKMRKMMKKQRKGSDWEDDKKRGKGVTRSWKNEQVWKSKSRPHSQATSNQDGSDGEDVHVMTQRPITTPWWRRHDSAHQVKDEVTPKWRWNAAHNGGERVTERYHDNKKLTTSSPPSTHHFESTNRMTTRRPKLLTYRRHSNSVSPRKHGGVGIGKFSKKYNPERVTKKHTVQTAAAASASDAIDCQQLGAGTFPDPQSCHRFIICMPGTWLAHPPHVMSCPYGTMFDENLNICNYASRVRCPYWKSNNDNDDDDDDNDDDNEMDS